MFVALVASQTCRVLSEEDPVLYGYEIISDVHHDSSAFTQGKALAGKGGLRG